MVIATAIAFAIAVAITISIATIITVVITIAIAITVPGTASVLRGFARFANVKSVFNALYGNGMVWYGMAWNDMV